MYTIKVHTLNRTLLSEQTALNQTVSVSLCPEKYDYGSCLRTVSAKL